MLSVCYVSRSILSSPSSGYRPKSKLGSFEVHIHYNRLNCFAFWLYILVDIGHAKLLDKAVGLLLEMAYLGALSKWMRV